MSKSKGKKESGGLGGVGNESTNRGWRPNPIPDPTDFPDIEYPLRPASEGAPAGGKDPTESSGEDTTTVLGGALRAGTRATEALGEGAVDYAMNIARGAAEQTLSDLKDVADILWCDVLCELIGGVESTVDTLITSELSPTSLFSEIESAADLIETAAAARDQASATLNSQLESALPDEVKDALGEVAKGLQDGMQELADQVQKLAYDLMPPVRAAADLAEHLADAGAWPTPLRAATDYLGANGDDLQKQAVRRIRSFASPGGTSSTAPGTSAADQVFETLISATDKLGFESFSFGFTASGSANAKGVEGEAFVFEEIVFDIKDLLRGRAGIGVRMGIGGQISIKGGKPDASTGITARVGLYRSRFTSPSATSLGAGASLAAGSVGLTAILNPCGPCGDGASSDDLLGGLIIGFPFPSASSAQSAGSEPGLEDTTFEPSAGVNFVHTRFLSATAAAPLLVQAPAVAEVFTDLRANSIPLQGQFYLVDQYGRSLTAAIPAASAAPNRARVVDGASAVAVALRPGRDGLFGLEVSDGARKGWLGFVKPGRCVVGSDWVGWMMQRNADGTVSFALPASATGKARWLGISKTTFMSLSVSPVGWRLIPVQRYLASRLQPPTDVSRSNYAAQLVVRIGETAPSMQALAVPGSPVDHLPYDTNGAMWQTVRISGDRYALATERSDGTHKFLAANAASKSVYLRDGAGHPDSQFLVEFYPGNGVVLRTLVGGEMLGQKSRPTNWTTSSDSAEPDGRSGADVAPALKVDLIPRAADAPLTNPWPEGVCFESWLPNAASSPGSPNAGKNLTPRTPSVRYPFPLDPDFENADDDPYGEVGYQVTDGVVRLIGEIRRRDRTGKRTTLGRLPVGYRPPGQIVFSVNSWTGSGARRSCAPVRLNAKADGFITILGSPKWDTLNLSDVSFSRSAGTAPTLEPSFTRRSKRTYLAPRVTQSGSEVQLAGLVYLDSGLTWAKALANSRVLLKLPADQAPPVRLAFCVNGHKAVVPVEVWTDGSVRVGGDVTPKNSWLSLAGISYSTAPGNPLALQRNFKAVTAAEGGSPLAWTKGHAEVRLSGLIEGVGPNAWVRAAKIARLPAGSRPGHDIVARVAAGGGVASIRVRDTGWIQFDCSALPFGAGERLSLAGVSFPVG